MDSRCELQVVEFRLARVREDRWPIKSRRLNTHLIYLVIEHGCDARIGGKSVRLAPYDLLWVRPGVRHSFECLAGRGLMLMYRLWFTLGAPPGDRMDPLPIPWLQIHHAEEMRPLMDRMLDEHRIRLPFSELRFRALLTELLTGALRRNEDHRMRKPLLTRAQREQVESIIDSSENLRIDPQTLARALGLSPDYFTKLFRNSFGLPPRVWIAHHRVHHATEMLLETSLSISEIANQLGYPDLFSFSRQFKEVMRESPRAFRQRQES